MDPESWIRRSLQSGAPVRSTNSDAKPNRYLFLDGMRGWGAIFVLLYHAFCEIFPVNQFARVHLNTLVPFNGLLAVTVFFLVSGFALASRFVACRNRLWLLRVGAGRYPRLVLPIFVACLITHLCLVAGLIPPLSDRPPPLNVILGFRPSLEHLLRFSFYSVFFDFQLASAYVGPLWTMKTELLGSFLVLGILAIGGSHWRRWLIYVALIVELFWNGDLLFLFVTGAALAELLPLANTKGLVSLGYICLLSGLAMPLFLNGSSPLFMLCAVALFIGVALTPSAKRSMETKLSLLLGRISFPLYLIHGTLFYVVGVAVVRAGGGPLMAGLSVCISALVAATLLVPVNEFSLTVSRVIGEFCVRVSRPGLSRLSAILHRAPLC